MILWPAIIHHAGQAELAYINDQSQWRNDMHLHIHGYRAEDRLIDSAGNIFSLVKGMGNSAVAEPKDQIISLYELLDLMRAHAAQTGLCCVDKLSADSVAEAIFLIGTMAHEA